MPDEADLLDHVHNKFYIFVLVDDHEQNRHMRYQEAHSSAIVGIQRRLAALR